MFIVTEVFWGNHKLVATFKVIRFMRFPFEVCFYCGILYTYL